MQFLIIAHDSKDREVLSRRLKARPAHISMSNQAIKRGEQLFGVAILNDQGDMCGSAMIVDFPSREKLEDWLAKEPYVKEKVWQEIKILPCKVGPSFTS